MEKPDGLGQRGSAFWERVVDEYEPAIDDLELLTETCRTLDLVEELQGRLSEKGVVTEIRLQRQLLARFLVQLGLPDEEGETMPSPASERGRRAAESRWAGHEKRSK